MFYRISIFWSLIVFSCNGSNEKKTYNAPYSKELIKEHKKGILNDWVIIKNNNFDTITLTLFDSAVYKHADIMSFDKNKNLRLWKFNPLPSCGNGLLYLDTTSSWNYDSANCLLVLTLNGGYAVEYDFRKRYGYKIDTMELGGLSLIKSKVYFDQRKYFGKNTFVEHK